jgi:hypothetical protein
MMSDLTIFTPKYLLLILEKLSTADVELLNKASKKLLTNRKRKASLERNKQRTLQEFLDIKNNNQLQKISLADIFEFVKKKSANLYHSRVVPYSSQEDLALKIKLKKSDTIEYFVHALYKHVFYAIVSEKVVYRLDAGYYNRLVWYRCCQLP